MREIHDDCRFYVPYTLAVLLHLHSCKALCLPYHATYVGPIIMCRTAAPHCAALT